MKNVLILVAFLSTQAVIVCGSGNNPVSGGRSASLGGVSAVLPGVWSVMTNQAGLAFTEGLQAGLFAENRFLMKELCSEVAVISWSGKPGAFGLGISCFGFNLYSEFRAGLTYARKFGKHFSGGVQLSYLRLQIAEGYASRGVVSCEIGFMYRPDIHWSFGMQVSNPVPVRLTSHPDELLPVTFRLGLGYCIASRVFMLLEGEKDLINPLIVRSGVEVRVAKSVYARIGMHTGPFVATGGIGVSLGRLGLDLATEYHMTLGFSPAVSLEYTLTKPNGRR